MIAIAPSNSGELVDVSAYVRDVEWQPQDEPDLSDLPGARSMGPVTLTGYFEPLDVQIVGGVRTRRRARALVDGRHTAQVVVVGVLPNALQVRLRKIWRLRQRRRGAQRA